MKLLLLILLTSCATINENHCKDSVPNREFQCYPELVGQPAR